VRRGAAAGRSRRCQGPAGWGTDHRGWARYTGKLRGRLARSGRAAAVREPALAELPVLGGDLDFRGARFDEVASAIPLRDARGLTMSARGRLCAITWRTTTSRGPAAPSVANRLDVGPSKVRDRRVAAHERARRARRARRNRA